MTNTTIDISSAQAARERHRSYLWDCLAPYYDEPLVLTEGQGCRVQDCEGAEYLDLFGGILTTGLGHCHPQVVAATREQAGRLGHVSSLYVHESQARAAAQLAEIAPGALRKTFFVNSGTEAVETALLLACQHTGRTEIVTLRLAYSGRSTVATNLTAVPAWRPMPSTVAGISHALAPYPYRCPFCKGPCSGDCVDDFANDLEQAIETTTSGRPAAFIAETILGVGGFIVPPPGYFERAAEIIRSFGGLFICDEVQAGFGRTGDHWFGIEHWSVEPDIMVMAKSIANGMPVGATITRDEIAASWTAKTISTFGGTPVSMAACEATLRVMQDENTPQRSAKRGSQLRAHLDRLAERFDWIGEVRGMGLMQGMELIEEPIGRSPSPARAKQLLEATRREGLLIGLGGMRGNVVRLGPSMLISEDEIEEAAGKFERACEAVDG